jgi:hypothetical protein
MKIFKTMNACFVLLVEDTVLLASNFTVVFHAYCFTTIQSRQFISLNQYLFMFLNEFKLFGFRLFSNICQLIVIQIEKLIF